MNLSLTNNILCLIVEQKAYGKTNISYWYYDISKDLRTLSGKKDEEPTHPMLDWEVKWMKEKYLTKITKL